MRKGHVVPFKSGDCPKVSRCPIVERCDAMSTEVVMLSVACPCDSKCTVSIACHGHCHTMRVMIEKIHACAPADQGWCRCQGRPSYRAAVGTKNTAAVHNKHASLQPKPTNASLTRKRPYNSAVIATGCRRSAHERNARRVVEVKVHKIGCKRTTAGQNCVIYYELWEIVPPCAPESSRMTAQTANGLMTDSLNFELRFEVGAMAACPLRFCGGDSASCPLRNDLADKVVIGQMYKAFHKEVRYPCSLTPSVFISASCRSQRL